MDELTFQEGVDLALDSLLASRLTLLAGAGLSMAPPSSLPSAGDIAETAKRRYDATYGTTRAPLPEGIEEQAEFFFQRGELATVYFANLIDQNAFAGAPNLGHSAIADLLLVRGIQTGVTTNVDCLIETAGQLLRGQIGTGIDGTSIAALGAEVAPLLKVHGCRQIDPANMVWAPSQVRAEPVASRITSSAAWLNVRLLNTDLLIVGFSTPWDYLNKVLEDALGAVNPSRVLVINMLEPAEFAERAPAIQALGDRANVACYYIKASASDFLEAVRKAFSSSFIRRVLHSGAAEFENEVGHAPPVEATEPPDLDNTMLWNMRRDLEGAGPRDPATTRTPADEPLLGLTLLKLRAGGAQADGPYWNLNGRVVRVLRAVNKPLHRVEAEYEREVAPTVAPEIVIAVGAESHALTQNIARANTKPTIARGDTSRWMTRADALAELGL